MRFEKGSFSLYKKALAIAMEGTLWYRRVHSDWDFASKVPCRVVYDSLRVTTERPEVMRRKGYEKAPMHLLPTLLNLASDKSRMLCVGKSYISVAYNQYTEYNEDFVL